MEEDGRLVPTSQSVSSGQSSQSSSSSWRCVYEDMGCVCLLCFHGSISLVCLHGVSCVLRTWDVWSLRTSKLAAATQGGIFSLIKSTNGMSYTYVCNICVLVLAWSTG